MRHVLAFDLDGVLFNFNDAYAKLLAETHGSDLLPTENPYSCWDWDLLHGYLAETQRKVWSDIRASKTFWEKLTPLSGAAEVVKRLNKLAKDGTADVYYITNRHGLQVKAQTEKALYNLGCHYPTVLITADKVPILKALGVTMFVDDKLETIIEAHSVVNSFLLDSPWNKTGRPMHLDVVSSGQEALDRVGLWK